MKELFSCRTGNYYNFYVGIDENKDKTSQLKMLKKLIDLELYYSLDALATIELDVNSGN